MENRPTKKKIGVLQPLFILIKYKDDREFSEEGMMGSSFIDKYMFVCIHECDCDCHTTPTIIHIIACCAQCIICKRNIRDSLMCAHLKECHNVQDGHDFE